MALGERGGVSKVAALTLVSLVAARFALMGLFESAMLATRMLYRPLAWWEGWPFFLAEFVMGTVIAGTGVKLLWDARGREALGSGLGMGLAMALVLVAANYVRLEANFFSVAFSEEPGRGNFPYRPGSVQVHTRGSGVVYQGNAQIGEDGRRICAPEGRPQEGDLVVTWVGDSFVYGLGIDDPDTLCWRIRENFEVSNPGQVQFASTTKPGASLHTYRWMVDFTIDEFGTDAVILGLLLPNDAEVLDVTQYGPLMKSGMFRLVASVLHPETTISLILSHQKVGKSEFFEFVSIVSALEALSEKVETRRVPTLVYMYDYASRNHAKRGELQPYVDVVERLAADNPYLSFATVVSDPPPDGRTRFRIPGDGHPTREGNTSTIEQLMPHLERFVGELLEASP